MFCRRIFLGFAFAGLVMTGALAEEADPVFGPVERGPVIEGYGPNYGVSHADFTAPENHIYKVVFDIADFPEDSTAMNRAFETPARFLNMHTRAGTPAENLRVAVVVHGKAAQGLLTDEAHQSLMDTPNPDRALVRKLMDAGVEVIVCGQTAAHYGYLPDKLMPGVRTAISAMTAINILQADGYTLNPF